MRIRINARNRGFQFDAAPGEAVLYAGLAAGIDLPYECATGTCGTCKAKLVDGRLHDAWPAAPGRKYVKPEQGEYLMCQCVADGDLTLEAGERIRHNDFGEGKVTAVTGEGAKRVAEVQFDTAGRKRLLIKIAPIEKI